MMANSFDVSQKRERDEQILREVRANRLGRRLRKDGIHHASLSTGWNPGSLAYRVEQGGRHMGVVLRTLAVGATLMILMTLALSAQRAQAADSDKIVFTSDRIAGVDNPTGDFEIFRMNPDGTGVRQLTYNKRDDFEPVISPDGTKVAYTSHGIQASNPEGDEDVYVMNTVDGSGQRNLSHNGAGVYDRSPRFSPAGRKIAYESSGKQTSNPEGDLEIYLVGTDGSGIKNLTNNGIEIAGADPVHDLLPTFSPDGKKIAYASSGYQTSNPEGDYEVYSMSALDGAGKTNLTNTDADIDDHTPEFSPDGQRISYTTFGEQTSNPEGDYEVYSMNALDRTDRKNLTNTGASVFDFSPHFSTGGARIVYSSFGEQTSNPGGDYEVYRLNALDGTDQKNLTNTGADIDEFNPAFSPDGASVVYESEGIQSSNPQGDREIYRAHTRDGKGKRNLTDTKAAYDGYFLPGQQ